MYTDADLQKLVKEYISKNEKELAKAMALHEKDVGAELKAMAEELVSDLEKAFINAQTYKDEMPEWTWGARITYKLYSNPDGTYRMHITFPGKYLFRQSLWKKHHNGFTGGGVSDIFELFTHGYTTSKKMPAGWWESVARMGEVEYIRAPRRWPAKPFVSDVVNAFESKYPFIKVEYPDEWHS